ncbi:T9SS type A sorting domain-containing protein [Emticicia agri]|uniref:T9SS type A sorting domain-containing protein n=1 Tax=Emticicia agri TaxID=2492393 RepID=A0A4Q5LTU5_9BACT|nr:T9SS type A sorting domain-containing protein [Emticicia agri]RYU92927.1 T9SS type A sorting domain-containing protein [Emticicia agri]
MKTHWPFIILLLLVGQGENLFAQWHCGMPAPTPQEKQALFARYQSFIQQKSSGKARETSYKVAVKINIISGVNTPAASVLNETDIRDIIAHANTYLQNINVELYLLNNQVFPIKDDKYVEFKVANEAELRKKYDVQNAINIYFAKNISLADLTVLSGYASLPSLATNSNRIFYSYFERTADDIEGLKNKTFLHELGHYFGLLHTFQDSKNPDISQRELVTRGAGANCAEMGDQLFDTPADPFERLPISAAFKCTDVAPADVVDANGDRFAPATNNFMSYYQNCGSVFTEQQYLKMQASFSIRFSPSAEYQITGQSSTNFVSIKSLNKSVYCMGDSVEISYGLDGLFDGTNQLVAELSDNSGKNYAVIDSKRRGNKILFRLPADLPEGENYHIRLKATRPETFSPISESFAVRSYAAAYLIPDKTLINAGETVDFTLSLKGSGTWSFDLSDGTSVKDTRQTTHTFTKILNETTVFAVTSIRNMCGEGQKNGGATIQVTQPQIRATGLAATTICQGQTIKLSISISGSLSFDNQLNIQISDPSGKNFTDLPTQVSLFNLSAQIPADFKTGSGYRLKVVAKNSALFSAAIGPLTVISPPNPPAVSSTINFCQNSTPEPLKATGSNIKWYVDEYDLKSYNMLTPSTTKEGTFTYYVTQTNNAGCESSKARVEVHIKAVPTAILSGDNTILLGDSTALKVNITGGFPASVTLSNGKNFAISANPFVVGVKPEQTTTYELLEVKNTCGAGLVSGSAKIIILEPLATEEIQKDGIRLFPNPASEQLTVEFLSPQPATSVISLIDMTGKVLQQNTSTVNQGKQELINLTPYNTGSYILKIKIGEKIINRKVMINK